MESVATLVDALRDHRLLEPQQLVELEQNQARFTEPRALARYLIQRDWLTPYQVNQLFQGKGAELVLGPYRLLERLGQGGMGMVYKARHMHMGRVVALKVIRKEKLALPDSDRRFHREIMAAAKLTHPNIVIAFDADRVGETHFFAMEYVDGLDLATVLKQNGPPSVDQACGCIRQVAQGLQHAYERGMVHRDIKPANLLITGVRSLGPGIDPASTAWPRDGVVKILDMGLARADLPDDPDSVSKLTKEGRVVGTPDYMAPEQATNPHTSDIRADLYSLGCTFYQLLTGAVPFPGGTIMEKLLKHRLDPPTPVEQLRPEVPPAVVAIVRNLMAKEPAQRYQKPAEVIQALDALRAAPRAVPVAAVAVPAAETPTNAWNLETALTEAEHHQPVIQSRRRPHRSRKQRPSQRRRRSNSNTVLWVIAGVLCLVGLLIFLGIMLVRNP